jgi:integrase
MPADHTARAGVRAASEDDLLLRRRLTLEPLHEKPAPTARRARRPGEAHVAAAGALGHRLAASFAAALRRAYNAAGIPYPVGLRPFHDLRVTAITNDAIAGANPVALMTKAGHSSMATTRRYLRLAGTVFREEADALEQRLLL